MGAMTLAKFRQKIAAELLHKVELAVIENDFDTARKHSEELLDLACSLAAGQMEGYRAVLLIADELADVAGFPFRVDN